MRVFVGHAIDAHQMRIMTLRDRSRTATYAFALGCGVEENGDISPDRQQGLRSSSLRLSSIRSAASWQIGRAHVCTPVTNAHLVCRLLLEQTKDNTALIRTA